MRVWDISPGYLNRESLLGEHRELHGIVSIITNNKKGYANHPETLRWLGHGWALKQRHRLLSAEMALRGYTDKTPVKTRSGGGSWPGRYIDRPADQLAKLAAKYTDKEQGRIPLPKSSQQLWSQHKYSLLARDQGLYHEIGRRVADSKEDSFDELARVLTEMLRCAPEEGGARNALQHMWGHVSDIDPPPKGKAGTWSSIRLIRETQLRALKINEPYLCQSTALGELIAWLPR